MQLYTYVYTFAHVISRVRIMHICTYVRTFITVCVHVMSGIPTDFECHCTYIRTYIRTYFCGCSDNV